MVLSRVSAGGASLEFLKYISSQNGNGLRFTTQRFKRLYSSFVQQNHLYKDITAFAVIGFMKRKRWTTFYKRQIIIKPFRIDESQKYFSITDSCTKNTGKFFVCTICDRGMPSIPGFHTHSKSESHVSRSTAFLQYIKESGQSFLCPVPGCRIRKDTHEDAVQHLLSPHRRDVECSPDGDLPGPAAQPDVSNQHQPDDSLPRPPAWQKPLHCLPCASTYFDAQSLREHEDSQEHILNVFRIDYRRERRQLLSNKHGVTITASSSAENSQFDDNVLKIITQQNAVAAVFTLDHRSLDDIGVKLESVQSCNTSPGVTVQLTDSKGACQQPSKSFFLKGRYIVQVNIGLPGYGEVCIPISFQFSKLSTDRKITKFSIFKEVEISYTNIELHEELKPTAPYIKRKAKPAPEVMTVIIPGVKPKFERTTKPYPVKLLEYNIQSRVLDAFKLRNSDSTEIETMLNIEQVESSNYLEAFHNLLWLEECQQNNDIRSYSMGVEGGKSPEGVTMRHDSRTDMMVLAVPGLAENRPSVLKGDAIYVKRKQATGQPENREYQGYVHAVEQENLKLKFGNEFITRGLQVTGIKFEVRFTVTRLPARMCHRAVEKAQKIIPSVLFPVAPAYRRSQSHALPPSRRMFNRDVETNSEQRQAVEKIVSRSSGQAPYLIFGPPGTGKSVTMVEAMKQVFTHFPEAKILACAPQNQAADLLCKRLLPQVDKRHVFRYNAPSRSYEDIPDKEVKEVSNYANAADAALSQASRAHTSSGASAGLSQLFSRMKVTPARGSVGGVARQAGFSVGSKDVYLPTKDQLKEYRIVVSTLVTSGRLTSSDLSDHFTHIFIDEAGHATEPETIIAIASLFSKSADTQVVFAGDPEQLGPVIRSSLARKRGLEKSLLERLMTDVDIYLQNDMGYLDPDYVTKLLRSFRSHPDILNIPNEMFYDGELEPHADLFMRERFCNWEHLPKRGFPLVFHGVNGRDEREHYSPSWFNSSEVAVLMDYVKMLFDSKGIGTFRPQDVGIISPYKQQVVKIRRALDLLERKEADNRTRNYKDIKVGSVEQFQGEERNVILISTVRTYQEFQEHDAHFNLGFLNNPKRFNVAVTRAKALLVIVGSPNILCTDYHWDGLIRFIKEKGGCTGVLPPSKRDPRIKEIIRNLQRSKLSGKGIQIDDVSDVTEQIDPPWERHE